jgi:phosphoribosylformylglycinamidine (FGAM) synthase-like amidotransferase family enzyme
MKFGVVVFPGSNCDQDMIGALRNDLHQEVIELWHKDHDLEAFPMVITFVAEPSQGLVR